MTTKGERLEAGTISPIAHLTTSNPRQDETMEQQPRAEQAGKTLDSQSMQKFVPKSTCATYKGGFPIFFWVLALCQDFH